MGASNVVLKNFLAVLLMLSLSTSEAHGIPSLFATINKALPQFSRTVNKTCASMLAAGIFAFCPLTGCDYGSSRTVMDVLGEKREGDQNISVFVDGVWWFGYQGGSLGYLRSDIVDESGVITFRQTLSGFVGEAIPNHHSIGTRVWLDHSDYRWFGTVVAVFDTDLNWNEAGDLYQIAVDGWRYVGTGDSLSPISVPRYILAYPRGGIDAEGFVFAEEAEDAQ